MVSSVDYKKEKFGVAVAFLMFVIALLFVYFMGSSLVHSTRSFWESRAIEELVE